MAVRTALGKDEVERLTRRVREGSADLRVPPQAKPLDSAGRPEVRTLRPTLITPDVRLGAPAAEKKRWSSADRMCSNPEALFIIPIYPSSTPTQQGALSVYPKLLSFSTLLLFHEAQKINTASLNF